MSGFILPGLFGLALYATFVIGRKFERRSFFRNPYLATMTLMSENVLRPTGWACFRCESITKARPEFCEACGHGTFTAIYIPRERSLS